MTLDLAQVSPQVRRMGQRLVARRVEQAARLEQARASLREWAGRWEELRELAEQRAVAQRLASPREPLDTAHPLPTVPADYRVVATDGSQIEPDRHGLAEYYLLNVGWAALRYGAQPSADLASEPSLAYETDDLFVVDELGRRRVPVQGSHLAARRARLELEKAVALAAAAADDLPLVVLQDGTLLLWVLEDRPEDFLRQQFLAPYVEALRACQRLGPPLASYISRPRATEVSALLRAAGCGATSGSRPELCSVCRQRSDARCALEALPDRWLFDFLGEAERSACFAVTLHAQLESYYQEQRIHFFYVNVGREIARVEVPAWVAEDTARLDLVHAVVVEQCRRGQGYPVALARAHECAIVRATDRDMVRLLIEQLFAREGMVAAFSEKEAAKRLHAV